MRPILQKNREIYKFLWIFLQDGCIIYDGYIISFHFSNLLLHSAQRVNGAQLARLARRRPAEDDAHRCRETSAQRDGAHGDSKACRRQQIPSLKKKLLYIYVHISNFLK